MRAIITELKRCSLFRLSSLAFLCILSMSSVPVHALEHCDSLTPSQFRTLLPNRSEAKLVQSALYTAYRANPEAPVNSLLTDGIVGKRTIIMFAQFCRDLGLKSGGDTASVLIASARELGALQKRWQDWRERVASEDFLSWTRTLKSDVYGGYFHLRETIPEGPMGLFLLDAFSDRKRPESTKATAQPVSGVGLYRLTKEDLALAGSGALELLQEVVAERFKTRRDLRAALGLALEGVEDDVSEIIDRLSASIETLESYGLRDDYRSQFVNGVPAELVERLDVLAQGEAVSREEFIARTDTLVNELDKRYRQQIADRVPTSPEEGEQTDLLPPESPGSVRLKLRAEGLPESILERLGPSLTVRSSRVVGSVTAQWKQRIAALVEPRLSFTLAAESLEEPTIRAQLQPLPENVAEVLATLTDVRFPDRHLFLKALHLSLPGVTIPVELETRILELARKDASRQTFASLGLTPVAWKGTACGCAPSGFSDGGYPDELYGLFPYWHAPQEGVESTQATRDIDFSTLSRVGYYGLGFDAEGQIIDELHWRERSYGTSLNQLTRRDFADFVYEAHQYRTRVDVVVYNAEWDSWVEGRHEARVNADKRVAGQLVDSIADLVTPELKRLSNRLKPVISFGISPRRTLGDGVTLDFDFSSITTSEAQWLFENHMGLTFFESLNDKLNGPSTDHEQDRLSINVMVPARCLMQTPVSADILDGCAYFQIENLQLLSDYVDLFVVDMSERGGNTKVGEPLTLDQRLEQVRSGIDTLADIKGRRFLLEKLVPLVVAGPAEADIEALSSSIAYERWNFAGLASWLLPSQDGLRKVARAEFLDDAEPSFLDSIEARVCGVVCPLRWYVRLLLFVLAASAVVYMLASLKWFGLRKVYGHKWFQIAVVAMTVLLLATFWCDPYWAKRQALLTLLLVAVILAIWLVSRRRKEMERTFP